MSEYLRDFINENVSIDCGGDKGLTSPEPIQDKINEILNRLDRLEAGLGMTITLQDQLALTFFEFAGLFPGSSIGGGTLKWPAMPMPESGSITRVTFIGHADNSNSIGTKGKAQFVVRRGSSDTMHEVEAVITNGPFSLTMNIPVLGDDLFIFKTANFGQQFTMFPCHAYLQLPARTYQVER